jgi:uncharacterized membrane protein
MKLVKVKTAVIILTVGSLTACTSQPITTLTTLPTETVVTPTEALTSTPASTDTALPTDTAQPATEPATEPAVQGATVSFANNILPIIESRCVNCHGGNRTEEGLVLKTHADVLAGSDNGPVVQPGDAAHSLLVEMVSTQEMPKRGPKLTPPQVQLFIDWINEGALDN